MIELPIYSNDNPDFLKNVERIVLDRIGKWSPRDIFVTRIENWFDEKWVKFSGTLMHEISIWKKQVTVPPFHPNRVENCDFYQKENAHYKKQSIRKPLHVLQESTMNLARKIIHFSDNGLFIWYSGNTISNEKGSVMGYLVSDNECFTFYFALAHDRNWEAIKVAGLTTNEIREILNTEVKEA